jgi:hypothetical protein
MPITTNADLLDGQLYFPGQETHLHGILNSISNTKTNKESTVIIPFGYGVARGSADGTAILPVDANSVFLGIAKYMNIEKRAAYSQTSGGIFGVPIDHECPVLEEGIIAVWVDGNVTEGGAVWWNHTASTSVVGAFRGAQNSSNNIQITGATWLASVTGGTSTAMKVAPLRLNRP